MAAKPTRLGGGAGLLMPARPVAAPGSALPKLTRSSLCLPLYLLGSRLGLALNGGRAAYGGGSDRLGRVLRGLAQVVPHLVADLAGLLAQFAGVLAGHFLGLAGPLPLGAAGWDQRGDQQAGAEGDQAGRQWVALSLLPGLLPEFAGLVELPRWSPVVACAGYRNH
ncbi:hypothetical protein [Micromonospora sp. NPDC047738]|uniref:hypothetical protein n=1 Tax=unclassified Micromonospora TaxID=2617518 RepID=UPI0033FBDACC